MSRAPSARDRLALEIFFRRDIIILSSRTSLHIIIREGANGRRNRIRYYLHNNIV